MLAYLRKGETFAELAAGSASGPPPPGVTETLGLLAARSPKTASGAGPGQEGRHAYVVIDAAR